MSRHWNRFNGFARSYASALVLGSVASESSAQGKAVSGAKVTGTFRSYFKGKFRREYNEIMIQALGRLRSK